MQDRLGPNRANIGPIKLKGILHFVADAREDDLQGGLRPGERPQGPVRARADPRARAGADRVRDHPVRPDDLPARRHPDARPVRCSRRDPTTPRSRDSIRMQMFQVDFGLIFYFAVLTLANYGGTIAGWASYNKWALLGGLRSSSQMMSYEVAMGLVADGRVPRRRHASSPATSPRTARATSMSAVEPAQLAVAVAAGRPRPVLHRGDRRDQARAVRHPRGRARDHRLLRRVLRHALGHVLPRRVHRDRLHLGGDRDRVLRRLPGAVPRSGRLPHRRLHRPGRTTSRSAAGTCRCRTGWSPRCSSRRSASRSSCCAGSSC